MKSKLQLKSCNIITAIQAKRVSINGAPYTRYGVGVQKRNPRRCITCGRHIKRGEPWQRDASAADPDGFGRIVTIRHSPRCPNEKARRAFQARLNSHN